MHLQKPEGKTPVLQGELLKQGKDSSTYKARWLELLPDGAFNWLAHEGATPNGSISVHTHYVAVDPEVPAMTAKEEPRFGFRLIPNAPNGRTLALQVRSVCQFVSNRSAYNVCKSVVPVNSLDPGTAVGFISRRATALDANNRLDIPS